MKRKKKAWVVIDHVGYAWVDFIKETRRATIRGFIKDTETPWRWWRRHGKRVVPCLVTFNDATPARKRKGGSDSP